MQTSKSRTRNFILQFIIGALIISVLVWGVDTDAIISILMTTDPFFFILAGGMYLIYNLLMAYRISYLLGKMGVSTDSRIFFAQMGGMLASDVTPARSGYFTLPYILVSQGHSDATDGMAAIVAPAGIEFILKVVGGFLGIMVLISATAIDRGVFISLLAAIILFMALGSIIIITMWSKESFSSNVLTKIPILKRFEEDYLLLKEKSLELRSSAPVIILISILCWIILGLQWLFLGMSLGIELEIYIYILLHPLITLLGFVPLTPSGLGVMEAGAAVVFYLLGPGSAAGFAFSILVRVNSIGIDLIGLRSISTIGVALKEYREDRSERTGS
ncbi:MAG: lysylphosphatidylglycerol synthase transmembrane domain-containing protein [Halobacteriota archaeon]|nr:lysylphosphatidylglycerol synthase transmembrane domain-containing protein [Halobacteriota archaeon]